MRVCDVVLNSIWYDPRVRKQIVEYQANNIDVVAVGLKCNRYNAEKIKAIPCPATVVKIDERFDGKQNGIFRKLKREKLRRSAVENAIIAYKPDVIHANDLNALIPAYHASKRLKCKLIYDSHEINVENYTTDGRSSLANIMKAIEKHIVRHIDLMVCVSNAAAEYFAATYKISKPMVVTNCSLKKETFTGEPIKHGGFEVLNHGQFYSGRGYDEMVEIAALVEEYSEIKICVRGFGKLENSMREDVKKKDLANFIFYPPVNVEQLIPEASHSHVGLAITKPICLNFKLSVSNKLFEYAAAGLPVIMSDIPEHRYLNDKYHFGIVLEDYEPKTISKAILKLYEDKHFYKICSQNAKKLSDEINWEKEFEKIINIEKMEWTIK